MPFWLNNLFNPALHTRGLFSMTCLRRKTASEQLSRAATNTSFARFPAAMHYDEIAN